MTDRSASDSRKAAKKDQVQAVREGDPDPKLAARLYAAEQEAQASRAKAHEAEKIKAESAQTAFGTPQIVHRSAPNDVIPGIEPSVLSATVDDKGNIKVGRS